MLKFLAKLFRKDKVSQDLESSIQSMVITSGADRRLNIRVNYPAAGAIGHLPRVSIDESPLDVVNISLGGVCLLDDGRKFGESVGQEVALNLSWGNGNKVLEQMAKVVGVHFDRRHMQFVDPRPELIVRLTHMLQPGYLGTKFNVIDSARISNRLKVTADELWIAPLGEHIGFYSGSRGDVRAEIIAFKKTIQFLSDGRFIYAEPLKLAGQSLTSSDLKDLAVCLANFKTPSSSVNNLLNHLQKCLSGEADDE